MPIIEMQDVRRRYGDTEALRGVSLSVEEGEIFGILGPNAGGQWRSGDRHHDRDAGPRAPRDRGRAAANRAGGAGQRRQARPRDTVAVTLSYMDDVASLDVRDDGVGFMVPESASASPSGGSA
jgi:hypothetical protein